MLSSAREFFGWLFEPKVSASRYKDICDAYAEVVHIRIETQDEVDDLTSERDALLVNKADLEAVNTNLQSNIATYQAERDKDRARIDAAIKALTS